MSKSPSENKMGTQAIGPLLFQMAVPVVLSMLVQALYNVVDSIYVSRVSESAVTAISLAFPIQNLLIGTSIGIAVGVSSLFSRCLGSGEEDRAKKIASHGVVLAACGMALFMLFGIFGAKPFFNMQSDVQETVQGGTAYIQICTIASCGIFFEVLFERLLQGTGRTSYTLLTQGVGAVLNILLDPVFIFGYFGLPAMGVAGAAVATVLGQIVAAILAFLLNWKKNPEAQINLRGFRLEGSIVGGILSIGVPSIAMMAVGSIMTFGMNQILQSFSETATGVFGIYFKVQSFIFMPIFGLNNAMIPIIAFNYGAKKPDRIMKTIRLCCLTAFCVMVAGFLAFQFIPDVILNIFDPSPDFMEIGCRALRTISFSFPLAAFGVVLGSVFQAMGNGLYSTIVALARQLVVLLPVAYLLSLSRNLDAVWLSFPIAEFMSILVTSAFMIVTYKKKIKPLRAAAE